MGQYSLVEWLWPLKSHRSLTVDEAIGHSRVKEEVRRSAKALSAGHDDCEVCLFELTGRCLHVSIPYTHPPCMCLKELQYNLTTYRRTGGGNSVSLFFFLTNDPLTVGKNVGVPEQISQLQK